MLSGLLYWDELFEASRTGAANAPDAALKTIVTERAILVLLNMVVSPCSSVEVVSAGAGSVVTGKDKLAFGAGLEGSRDLSLVTRSYLSSHQPT